MAAKAKSSKMCKRLINDTKKKIARLEKELKAAKAKVNTNEADLKKALAAEAAAKKTKPAKKKVVKKKVAKKKPAKKKIAKKKVAKKKK